MHHALVGALPRQGIAGGRGGIESMQLFAVLLRHDGLPLSQQQLAAVADHIYRQWLADLQQGDGNRNVFHGSTTTGTRCASAHINS